MNGTLNERDLKKNPSTQSLPVIDEHDCHANRYLDDDSVFKYAEASDSIRLFELLHRDEYEPVAAVRGRTGGSSFIRVYFRQLHGTDSCFQNEGVPGHSNRSGRPLPR
jgi:hypothetical protein